MFSAAAFSAYALSCITGYFFIRLWINDEDGWISIFLSPGAGLGFTALLLFLEVYFAGKIFFVHTVLALLAVASVSIRVYSKKKMPKFEDPFPFFFVSALALLLAFCILAKSPYGTGLDVWAIWKLKARYLFESRAFWKDYFVPQLGFSHEDYPLFYPLALVWGWAAAGKENLFSGWALSLIFTVSAAGLLMAALPRGKGRWLAGLLLVSTPHFTGMGGSQYADIFVAYFGLAAIFLLAGVCEGEPGELAALGFLAGAGAFTKNEGFLLLFCAALVCFPRKKTMRFLLAGALPWLLCIFLFKLRAAAPNEVVTRGNFQNFIVSGQWISRPAVIFSHVLYEVTRESSWVYAWVLAGLFFVFFAKRLFRKENRAISSVFFLWAAGYFFAYLMTPLELNFHLDTSLDRLMLHLFPAALFIVFRNLEAGEGKDLAAVDGL